MSGYTKVLWVFDIGILIGNEKEGKVNEDMEDFDEEGERVSERKEKKREREREIGKEFVTSKNSKEREGVCRRENRKNLMGAGT